MAFYQRIHWVCLCSKLKKFKHLFKVVHSVHGIMFKDLKQILRKEQCDASILLTANVPAAKKIVVHGPRKSSFVLFLLFLQY